MYCEAIFFLGKQYNMMPSDNFSDFRRNLFGKTEQLIKAIDEKIRDGIWQYDIHKETSSL